jgi:very-short-patch-repair endonuclease
MDLNDTSTPAVRLAVLAQQRGGVFTGTDALTCGLAADDVLRMVRQGWWRVLHPAVYVASGAPLTTSVREAAALAFHGSKSLLSHASAAHHHRLEVVVGRDVFVTLPFRAYYRPRPGIVLTRTRHMPPPVVKDGLVITPVHRTLVDLARDLDLPTLRSVLADAVRRKRTTLERVLAAAEGLGGRAGLADLRRACDEIDPELESALEEEALPLLRAAGLIAPVRQREVHDLQGRFVGRLDFADEELKLAVEIDGWGHHSSPEARSRDSRRDRRLAALGWVVVRFTTDDVRRGSARMIADLTAVLKELRARSA